MRGVRKVFFWVHLVAGLLAGIVIAIMAATGMILAFERPITALVNRPVTLEQTGTDERLPIQTVLARVGAGKRNIPTDVVVHRIPAAMLEVRFGREVTLYANPWTGEVVGEPSEALKHFFHEVEELHRAIGFGMRNAFGRGISGAADLVFLLLLISGLYLWLPKLWSSAVFRSRWWFKSGLTGKAREWNWHHVFGLWFAAPLLLITITGAILAYPWATKLLFTLTGSQPSSMEQHRHDFGRPGEHGEPPTIDPKLDQWIMMGIAQVPDWKQVMVPVADNHQPTLMVMADTSLGDRPEAVTRIFIDRRQQKVIRVERFADNSLGQKLRVWARFVHTGEEFGLIGELVAAFSALAALLLVYSGFAMAWRRFFQRPGRA